MNNKVKFLRGTSNEYAAAKKDSDTIYFTTDDGKLYIGDKEVSGDGSITVDDTLSDTSTNPVQNKVVKQAIDNKADKSKYGDTTINVGRKAGTIVGHFSTAEGQATTANSLCSHAEGDQTTASGSFSHSEGEQTKAIGAYSHAEGCRTEANGSASHAEGRETTAFGDYSHTSGYYTKTLHDNEAAYGKYNESNDNTLFSIGDGTADNARHNAFEITTTGGKLHDKDIATTDLIPTELPANGGNADTVDGKHANDFITSQAIQNLTTIDDCITAGTYAISTVYTTDMPTIYGTWGICDVRTYGLGIFQTIKYTDTAIVICRSKIEGQIEWTKWKEISTTPIKSVEVGGTTNIHGNFMIWKASDRKIPVYAKISGYYVSPFLIFTADDYYYYLGLCDAESHEWVTNTAVSGTVYYIEI